MTGSDIGKMIITDEGGQVKRYSDPIEKPLFVLFLSKWKGILGKIVGMGNSIYPPYSVILLFLDKNFS
jgi:hypothetical protein